MSVNGVITFWSVDAFLTLAGTNVYRKLTPELISRISAFVDSYVLFDKVCLPERYNKYSELKELGGEDVFKFIPSDSMRYCDDFSKGLIIDLNLVISALPEILKEDKYWSMQHDPDLFEEIYKEPNRFKEWGGSISQMRLSLWTTMSAITKNYGATAIHHNSLAGLDKYENIDRKNPDYIYSKFIEFTEQYQGRIISASKSIDDSYIDTIKNFPPLLASLLDRAKNNDQLTDILKTMRYEYRELRTLRSEFSNSISQADSIGEKRDIIESWNKSWNIILKREFKKTGLISRKISSNNIVNMLFNVADKEKILKFLTEEVFQFSEEAKQIKQFKIFSTISKDTDSIYFNNLDMYKKFGIESIVKS